MKDFNKFKIECRWYKGIETRQTSSGVTYCDKCIIAGVDTKCNKESCMIYAGGEQDAANKKKTAREKTGKH